MSSTILIVVCGLASPQRTAFDQALIDGNRMQQLEPTSLPKTQATSDNHNRPARAAAITDWVKSHPAELVLNGSLIAVITVLLIQIYGLVPYQQINALGINLIAIGQSESLALSGFNGYLPHMGYPLGSPVVFGLPFTIISALLVDILNANPYGAFIWTSILFLFVATSASVLFIRSFRVSLPIALVFTFMFYAMSFIWGHLSYGQLPFSFAMLPAYLLLDKLLLERLYAADKRRWTNLIWILLAIGARIFSLFMDGYTFVIWAVASGCIFLWYGIRAFRQRQFAALIVSLIVLATANGFAYVLYGSYVPGGSEFDVMPIEFFRAMSVDLMTLFVPYSPPYALSLFGLTEPFYLSRFFYGDGSNVAHNYLGYALLVSLAGYLIRLRREHRFLTALLVAALAAFILSIGPSLKINSQRAEPNPPGAPWLYEDYLMPAEEAVISLGTDVIYTEVPGINNMRAVYRWLLLPKFVLVVTGAIFAQYLVRRRRFIAVSAIICLGLIEAMPPIPELNQRYHRFYDALQQLNADVVEPLREHIQPGDRILFFSPENDFLANYIAPLLNAYAYNVGGDKNMLIAFEHWPDGVKAVRWEIYVDDYVTQMMSEDQLDWFIIPLFSMRWNSYRWPPTQAEVEQFREHRSSLFNLNNENFTIIESEYFYLVRFNDWLREQLGLS